MCLLFSFARLTLRKSTQERKSCRFANIKIPKENNSKLPIYYSDDIQCFLCLCLVASEILDKEQLDPQFSNNEILYFWLASGELNITCHS